MSADLRELWSSAGGNVPDHWEFKTIEELLEHSKSISVGVMYPGSNSEDGIPLIKVSDVKNGAIASQPEFCVSKEVDEEYKRTRLNGTELLITLVGNPGDCVVATNEMAGWNAARALAVVRLKNIELRAWLRYVLLSKPAKHLIEARLNTTVQKTLNLKDVRELGIPIPPKKEREGITDVIDVIEKKMLLNRQTNQTLEHIAQALFKCWFVDFEPTRAKIIAKEKGANTAIQELAAQAIICGAMTLEQLEAITQNLETTLQQAINEKLNQANQTPINTEQLKTTAALFPNELVESDGVTNSSGTNLHERSEPEGAGSGMSRLIPEGWEVLPLSKMIQIIGGGTPKKSESDYWDGDIPWFSVKDAPADGDVFVIDTDLKITELGLSKSSTKLLPEGVTIISARGTVGRLALVGVPTAMNQSCYGIKGANGAGTYLNYFNVKNAVEMLQQNTHGAVFDTITTGTFDTVYSVNSGQKLKDVFEALVSDNFKKIKNNLFESNGLIEIRDTLLPKLLSGELKVS